MTTAAESLLREREGYARRGLDDRVAQVDAQLALLEVAAEAEPEPAEAPVEAPVDDEAEAEPDEETAAAGPAETTSRRKR